MAVKFQDYYETIGVARSASQEEIKRAYRKLARKYHPDTNKTPEAEAKMKELNEAYEVLKDPDKRAKYDELGANYKAGQDFRPPPGFDFNFGGPGAGGGGFRMDGGNFSDFFEMFFGKSGAMGGGARARGHGGARAAAPPGADVEAEISITLEDAMRGGTRGIKLQAPDGVKSIDVKIPPGATSGSVIRLSGQGQPSPMGGPAGDLRLKVKIAPHPRFEVNDHDLVTDLRLAPWEAALGAKIDVPLFEGTVSLTVPAGAQSGQKVRIKGKGLPRRSGEAGDLYVRFVLAVPKAVTDEDFRGKWLLVFFGYTY